MIALDLPRPGLSCIWVRCPGDQEAGAVRNGIPSGDANLRGLGSAQSLLPQRPQVAKNVPFREAERRLFCRLRRFFHCRPAAFLGLADAGQTLGRELALRPGTVATSIDSRGNLGCSAVQYSQIAGVPSLVSHFAGTLNLSQMPGLGGDLQSAAGSNQVTVTRLRGISIHPGITPSTGLGLIYDGSYWTPSAIVDSTAIHSGTTANQSLAGALILNDSSTAASQNWVSSYVSSHASTGVAATTERTELCPPKDTRNCEKEGGLFCNGVMALPPKRLPLPVRARRGAANFSSGRRAPGHAAKACR
jgi:hypothetical protein